MFFVLVLCSLVLVFGHVSHVIHCQKPRQRMLHKNFDLRVLNAERYSVEHCLPTVIVCCYRARNGSIFFFRNQMDDDPPFFRCGNTLQLLHRYAVVAAKFSCKMVLCVDLLYLQRGLTACVNERQTSCCLPVQGKIDNAVIRAGI